MLRYTYQNAHLYFKSWHSAREACPTFGHTFSPNFFVTTDCQSQCTFSNLTTAGRPVLSIAFCLPPALRACVWRVGGGRPDFLWIFTQNIYFAGFVKILVGSPTQIPSVWRMREMWWWGSTGHQHVQRSLFVGANIPLGHLFMRVLRLLHTHTHA